MTAMMAELIRGGGARIGTTPAGGGASSAQTTQTWVLRSITRAGQPHVLPRTLTVTLEDGAYIIDDDGANAYGAGATYSEGFDDYLDSLQWLAAAIDPSGSDIDRRQLAAVRSMLTALAQ